MARPIKKGLDYFSFDCDFYENKKVKKIMRACGPASGTVLSCLLCNIYRWKGYYILWDQDLPFDISGQVGMSEGAVTEIITKALQVEFFNQEQFEKNKILTSEEVQNRYLTMTEKRVLSVIDVKYLVISEITGVSGSETGISDTVSTQSKVKESKVKESRGPHATGFLKKIERKEEKITGPKFSEILEFFESQVSDNWKQAKISIESQKFFNHYEAMGWKIRGQNIQVWQAKANEWIIREVQSA